MSSFSYMSHDEMLIADLQARVSTLERMLADLTKQTTGTRTADDDRTHLYATKLYHRYSVSSEYPAYSPVPDNY